MSTESETLNYLQDIQDIQNWLFQEKHESRCLEMMEPEELNRFLSAFFSTTLSEENSNQDLGHFKNIFESIKKYLQDRNYKAKLTDTLFRGTQEVLENKGVLKRPQIQLDRVSPEREDLLWLKGHFGAIDGTSLNATLVYYFTKFFDLKTKADHKALCFGDVVLRSGDGNIRYLEFDPRLTRGHIEGNASRLIPTLGVDNYGSFEPKLVFQGGSEEKDPVLLFEAFIQRRSFRTRRPRSPMYLQPLLNHSNSAREWYEDKPLSTKSLNRIIRCISRKGKVRQRHSEQRQKANKSQCKPPLQIDPVESEAVNNHQLEIVSVEQDRQVYSPTGESVTASNGEHQDSDFGYDDEVNSIMNSNSGTLVPAGRSGTTDLNNLSPGSRLEFTGDFGQSHRDYGRDRNYGSSSGTGSDVPFSLFDILRDDVSSLRAPSQPARTISPLLQPPHPLDSGLGDLGPGYAPRSYGQDPPSRLSGRSRLQGRLNALRGGTPEPRPARDTWSRFRGTEDIRSARPTSAYQPRGSRWSSQEDLYDGYDSSYPAPRPAIGYREGTGTGRYSPDIGSTTSRRDDYVHNTQRRIDEAIASRPNRMRPDRTTSRRYNTQPIDFNYSSYNSDRVGSNSDISAPSAPTMSYARQALQRAEDREARTLNPPKSISPPPGRRNPTPTGDEEGPRNETTEEENIETEEQKEQRKAIRAKMLAGTLPQGSKSTAAKKKLILDETKLEEMFLKCLICGDIFNSTDRAPKLLPCHHTFCLSCLLEMFRVEIEQRQSMVSVYHNRLPSAVRIGCPTCRDSQIISQQDLKKMANDRTVLSLLDLVVHSESCVVNYCSRHQTQPLNFFCETCIQPVCCDCTVLDHMQSDDHVVMNIEGALNKYKPLIEECLNKLSNHASELMESKTILEGAIHTLDTNRNEVMNKLKETFQQFRTAAQDREEELAEISQREIGRKKGDLSKCLELVLKRRHDLQSMKADLKSSQDEENVEQVYTRHKKLKALVQEELAVPDKLLDNDFSANLDFDDTEQTNVIFKLSEFGEVIFEHL